MNHEAINQRIQALESELAGLKAELNKPEKFEFKYSKTDNYMINYYGVHRNLHVMNKDYLQNFRYRQTEANAKADFQLQKELMCIGALAEQIDPTYKSKIPDILIDSCPIVTMGRLNYIPPIKCLVKIYCVRFILQIERKASCLVIENRCFRETLSAFFGTYDIFC